MGFGGARGYRLGQGFRLLGYPHVASTGRGRTSDAACRNAPGYATEAIFGLAWLCVDVVVVSLFGDA